MLDSVLDPAKETLPPPTRASLCGSGQSVACRSVHSPLRHCALLRENRDDHALAASPEENAHGPHRRDILRRISAYRDAYERVQGKALERLVDSSWLREAAEG